MENYLLKLQAELDGGPYDLVMTYKGIGKRDDTCIPSIANKTLYG